MKFFYIFIFLVIPANIYATVLKCHEDKDESKKATIEGLREIDDHLDDIYARINTTADYHEACDHVIPLNKNGNSGEEAEETLTLILERLEIRRASYSTGLWGYCAEDGAAQLKKEMDELKIALDEAADSNNRKVTICDRKKLLMCHHQNEICDCLQDNRNFRNTNSEYWDNAEHNDTAENRKQMLLQSQCVLTVGSNCPLANESPFLCQPGSSCLFKYDKTPCVTHHINATAVAVANSKFRYKRGTPTNPRYSFINDFFPSTYCQCYSFVPDEPSKDEEHDKNGSSVQFSWITSKILTLLLSLHLYQIQF